MPPLDSIDVAGALKRMAGNARLYRRLLWKWIDTESDAATRLRGKLEASEQAAAARDLHTLRGAAANLGLTEVAASAARLEQALNAGRDGTALLAEFETTLARTRGVIATGVTRADD